MIFQRTTLRILALLALSTALFLDPSTARAEAKRNGLTCARIPELSRTYLNKHFRYHYLNDELRERVVETYVKRLDSSKSLYLRDEVTALRAKLKGTLQDVREGDCGTLHDIHEDLVRRYSAMEAYVRTVLEAEDYAIDTDAVLIIDPEKRGHARTVEDQNDLVLKLVHFQMSNYVSSDMELAEAKKKLVHRYELMTKRARDLSQEDIYSGYLDAFASALDPHSNYLSSDVLEDFQISMGLSLEGIGVALSSRDGYSVVEEVIPGGAADSLDILKPKDKIIAVAQDGDDSVDIIDMELRDVVRLIRGKRGTKVHLTILRQDDTTERFNVAITREKINLEKQAAKLHFENVEIDGKSKKLAILELPSFYGGRNPGERQSSRDVEKLLEEVKKEGADGLVLDLSRNGGGLLENSVDIAGYFIEDGGVVAVKDTFSKVQVLRDRDTGITFEGPMVVLTSRVSASASEIVAGALKDYGRAVIVGDDHTFGKGTVQSMVPLPTGLGALKVTTAVFFRPGGKSTQHSGVASHVVIPSVFATDEFGEMHQDYSLPSQTIPAFLDSPQPAQGQTSKLQTPWAPISQEVLTELSRRSLERVATNEDFEEIRERLAKAEERNGVVNLADLIKEKEEAAAKAESEDGTEGEGSEDADKTNGTDTADDTKGDAGSKSEGSTKDSDPAVTKSAQNDDEPSPQQREAVQVLADLIRLTG